MARQHAEDDTTRAAGGETGWIRPDATNHWPSAQGMKTKSTVLQFRSAMALALALWSQALDGAPADTIRVSGADMVVVLLQTWAEAFMKRHPDMVVQAISQDKRGIGYSRVMTNPAVRGMAIAMSGGNEPIVPSAATIASQTYPLSSPLCAHVNPSMDQGSVARFLSWVCSDEGQDKVPEAGFHPLPGSERGK